MRKYEKGRQFKKGRVPLHNTPIWPSVHYFPTVSNYIYKLELGQYRQCIQITYFMWWFCIMILMVSINTSWYLHNALMIYKKAFNLYQTELIQQTDLWYFSYFSQKIGSDISCILTPQETPLRQVAWNVKAYFLGKIKIFRIVNCCCFFLPSMLSIKIIYILWQIQKVCFCWGFMAQSTQRSRVKRGQFT